MFSEVRVDNAAKELYQVNNSGFQMLDVSNRCSVFRREIFSETIRHCSIENVKPEKLHTSFNMEAVSNVLSMFPDFVLLIKIELCRRHYTNSNFNNFQKNILLGTVEAYLDSSNIFIENFLSIFDLKRILLKKMRILKGRSESSDYAVLKKRRYDLVLSPKVCSVLIHELVGHFLEERNEKITKLLPDGVNILAKSIGAFDDEGEPSDNCLVVENGRVLYSKNRCFLKGFCQSGIHGGEAVCRLTNLSMIYEGNEEVLPEEYVLCADINTCQYLGDGKAYINIKECWYCNKNTRQNVGRGFFFFVSVSYLKQGYFWGNPTEFIGVCTKNHESLITKNEAGFCLLKKQRIYSQVGDL